MVMMTLWEEYSKALVVVKDSMAPQLGKYFDDVYTEVKICLTEMSTSCNILLLNVEDVLGFV